MPPTTEKPTTTKKEETTAHPSTTEKPKEGVNEDVYIVVFLGISALLIVIGIGFTIYCINKAKKDPEREALVNNQIE